MMFQNSQQQELVVYSSNKNYINKKYLVFVIIRISISFNSYIILTYFCKQSVYLNFLSLIVFSSVCKCFGENS